MKTVKRKPAQTEAQTSLEYGVFNTHLGWMAAAASDEGLLALTLPQKSAEDTLKLLGEAAVRGRRRDDRFYELVCQLRDYMWGKRVAFNQTLDLSWATPFQRRVWQEARRIPFGESRSYGWIAEQLGQPGASRAVGQALGRNPLPVVIPCHRVLAKGGGLGGYSGGLDVKRRLLKLEGVTVRE